ncbi:E3 ubiquitin-protein ligase Praja-2 [Haliaeetus albicilla]|uniref:E3 ubiquitin-protein ligase Praja-2 n=1 Tax=Haliaeetus leucocephalus TaxID=52644 RepID=UPI0005226445|nr:PREDICTED: E3 ubiquitin-protein ligase Praja-2 [Haliaeetus albicilla]XP_010561750.1 PREDICTED: E3 ubiquitin-protein ligase Praja-2 [Haliaeetus leucocephalus]
MGQEAGKLAWPRPAGGYRTITRRRYRRRHAYVSFRPSLNSQDRDERQHYEDREGSNLENVQTGSSLSFSEDSNPSAEVSSGLLDEPVLENTGAGEPVCQSVLSQTSEADTSPFSLFSYGLEDNQISGNLMNTYENSEAVAGYASGGSNDLNGQNGIAFVNIDSYEPDSSDGEENDAQETFSLAREVGLFQEALGNLLSELEGGIESFTELQSQLPTLNHSVSRECCEEAGPMPLTRYFSIDSDLACPNNMTIKPSAEDQAIPKSSLSGASYETQQIKTVDVAIGTPTEIANELNVSDGNTAQGNSPELVVRPKIRKQNTANKSEREKLLANDDEEEGGSWRKTGITEVQQGRAEYALRNSKERRSMFFDSRDYEGDRKNTKIDQRKNAAAQEQKNSSFWDEFEDCSRYFSMTLRDEDSSDCSDGEWSPVVPTYLTATEKEESSSDESWESAPGKEEHGPEVQSNSSGVEEKTDFCFQGGEQILLEEEEIPWLQYREEVESSSDEENYPFSDFLHPVFFLLDGNNNFEDDSSVSEDLDVEWRLLDEFGDGLGLAQAIPYMNPQFLTIMALEGRLQQAMEIVLTYLETLGFDVEQAHPPATKETIDCLPQITVTDDQDGQEQRCTICCSEYVKDEIITELPCHHLFHKTCITLWLQKSGTCPICRHVLAPVHT